MIADSITHLAGFRVAVISVVRDDGFLHPVAISGPALPDLPDGIAPAEDLLKRLDGADDWGRFKFVPSERVDPADFEGWGWIPEITPLEGEDAWQPLDFLVAPFNDDSGQFRGILSIDMPEDGRRPGPEHREVLNRHAALAGRALLLALARTDLEERERVADHARAVVRLASRALSLHDALDEAREPLVRAFDLSGLWVWLFDRTMVPEYELNVGLAERLDPVLYRGVQLAMPRLWKAHRPGMISLLWPEKSDDRLHAGRRYLVKNGFGSAVYTPIGAGDRVLGALVLLRGTSSHAWSDYELEAAFEIGRDLGRILTNVATFEREKTLASELHRLDAFKSDLISTVSHELKNPLTSILGNLELVGDPDLPPERTEAALGALTRSTHRMAGIVDELRELYDTDPDRLPGDDLVDLVPLARGACELVSTTAEQRRLSLDLDLPSSPALTPGEARELDRVVVNLVSNAVKYTPDGGTVSVAIRAGDDEVEVCIRDTGIGISADDQSHLFDEFFRSPDPAARTQPGTGLGLTIVDRIVRRHGGRIDVVSDIGAGSTFTVHLPAARRSS